jgi:uncharacterized membrane protein YbjE (DUF340 family)
VSILIIITLILGIFIGGVVPIGEMAWIDNLSSVLMLLLLFSVGIDIGLNKQVFRQIKMLGFKILLIPIGVAAGSLLGGLFLSMFVQESIKECLAISAGLGWYSLSGILITEAGHPVAGTISFLSNVFREILTFICVPFIAKYLNYYCAIAPGGATAMDTTLAVISRNTNAKVAILAFTSGFTLTMAIPFLIPIFL